MIKNIIFDWSKVCTLNGMSDPMSAFIASELHLDKKHVKSIFKSLEDPYVKGLITGDDFIKRLIGKLGVRKYDLMSLRGALVAEPEINKDIIVLLKRLKNQYNLILFSDSFKEMADLIIKKYSLDKLFNKMIFSHELGLRKPESKIYEKLIELTKINPDESLFIDDREVNIIVAKEHGFKTILYKDYKKLFKELNLLFEKAPQNEPV